MWGVCVRYEQACNLINPPSPVNNGTVHSPKPSELPQPEGPSVVSTLPHPCNGSAAVGTKNWLQDLELLHHYSTNTWRTFLHEKNSVEVWQITITRIACQCEYLMHGLPALSALHLAHLAPSKGQHYYFMSTRHQNLAIAGFRNALPHVDQDSADATTAASMMMAGFAYAS